MNWLVGRVLPKAMRLLMWVIEGMGGGTVGE